VKRTSSSIHNVAEFLFPTIAKMLEEHENAGKEKLLLQTIDG
jgi:hypothetical protein